MNEENPYLSELYSWISQVDATFGADVAPDVFATKMQDQQYAAQIYEWVGNVDPSYKTDFSIDVFLEKVGAVKKKAEPPKDGESSLGDTSLAASSSNDNQQFPEPLVAATDTTINGYTVKGTDTRQDSYTNPTDETTTLIKKSAPMTGEGGWIAGAERARMMEGDETYQQANAQRKADEAYTAKLVKAEEPFLVQMQEKESTFKAEKEGKVAIETEEVIGTEEFKTALQGTTPEAIGLEEDDAIEYFNNLYADYGFTFRKIGIGDAMEVREKTNGNTLEIDLDPFFDSTEKSEAIKLQNFLTTYARKPEEIREVIEDNMVQASLRAHNLRDKARKNEDGTESTVLFESAIIDGKNVVYPTLFPKHENMYTSDPDFWVEKEGMEAYDMALERGEVFNFETPEEANSFAAGSWKDINSVDAEADSYFKERGYDYVTLKEQFDTYQSLQDKANFIDKAPFKFTDLTEEQKLQYKDFYDPKTGQLRNDIQQVQDSLWEQISEWSSIYTDDDLQQLREDYDVFIDAKYQKLSLRAAKVNAAARYVDNELKAKSLSTFGVGIEELVSTPVPEDLQPQKNAILTTLQSSKDISQLAANQYELANTWLDSKFDKHLKGEIVENYAGMEDEWTRGWYRGKVGNEILKMSLGLEDIGEDASVAEISEAVVAYMDAAETGKVSRGLYRWHSARGFVEAWDAFYDNPAELSVSLAANSLSQMLPYGYKIIPALGAAGAGTGAMVGAIGGPLTAGGGALAGLGYGLRSGFAATSFALEYTNEVMDAARHYGYNIHDAQSMKDAFQDDNVWKRGLHRGKARGIPIGVMDFISGGLAGRVFQIGKTSAVGARMGAVAAERVVMDPFFEGAGELAAQLNVGDEVQWKEIVAEALGGFGNNAPMASFNMAMDLRAKNNIEIANEITSINGILNETRGVFAPSLARVSAWGNNMHRLGQISAESNQRIQQNIGLIRDSKNIIDANPNVNNSEKVMTRMMELMSAKEELESTPNKKSVFKNKLKEINTELQEIAETGNVRRKGSREGNNFEAGYQTSLGAILTNNQTSDTDVRETTKAAYSIDGKTLSRKAWLTRVNDMSEKQLEKSNIIVHNDEQATEILKTKVKSYAISKQEAGSVDADKQTGDIQAVEETVREVSEETIEPTTTPEATEEVSELKQERDNIKSEGQPIIDKYHKLKEEGKEIQAEKVFTDELMPIQNRVDKLNAQIDELQQSKPEVEVQEETIEEVVVPESVIRPTKADKTAYDDKTIEQTRLDGILAAIADKQISGKKLTKFQEQLTAENKTRIEEIVSSKTLKDEVTDLEETLSQDKTKVDFKRENKFVPDVDEVTDIMESINSSESGNVLTEMDDTQQGVTIDVDEINTRTERPIPKLKSLAVIKGVPVVFSISDQLTTGNVVNPQTGTTIDNLKGGIGFTGTIDNENAAWANTREEEATALIEKAIQIYEGNKETFEKWWAANPEYKGLVPMPIVKMGETSILSNEATFRVFRDNLTKIPEANRKKAMQSLEAQLEARIKTRQEAIDSGQKAKLTVRNYKKDIKGIQKVLQAIKAQKPQLIDDVLTEEFLQNLSLPERTTFLTTLTVGEPNEAGTTTKTAQAVKPIPKILIEGMDKDAINLVHIASITDLITEPGLKNVTQRSIVAVQGIDVLTPEVIEASHPNYPFGVKGKSMGILENPVALVKAYPDAYKKAMEGLVAQEKKGKTVTAQKRQRATKEELKTMPEIGELEAASVGTILAETLGVQMGLTANEFIGAISLGNMDNVSKLTSFMNIAFPSVNISTDTQTFNTVMEQDNVTQYRKGNEVIYGVTVDGDVYINPDVHNSTSALHNTAIHEMGHVWTDYLQTTPKGRQIYAKGVTLIEQTEEYQKQLKKFDGNKKKAANEAMAILIGNKGQTIADASVKSKFTEWLLGMWTYIKNQFKQTEDLSVEEVENLTLDEFIGSALADIFSGKKIKLSDKQLKTLRNPEAAFSTDLSMTQIIERGRQNGFSDSSIKQVLRARGFKVREISEAMTVNFDYFTEMPPAFERIDGGIQEAYSMFNDLKVALSKYAIGKEGVKTFAEIRQKAQELIQDHPTYKKQQDQVQRELRIDFDKALGMRRFNRGVSQELSALRSAIRENRIGVGNQKAYVTRLKNLIRKALPDSKKYSHAKINRLINSVAALDVRKDNFSAQIYKVLGIIEEQRVIEKRATIAEIAKLAKDKAKPRTQSKKAKSKGVDALGQVKFAQLNEVLDAVTLTNLEKRTDALDAIKAKLETGTTEVNNEKVLNSTIIDRAIEKSVRGEPLVALEEKLMALQMAYDTFGDIQNKTLEEVQELLKDVKIAKTEAIMRFNSRRLKRAADNQIVAEQATEQIEQTNPDLFTEEKDLKDNNEIAEDLDKLKKDFTAKGIIKKVFNTLTKDIFGRTEGMITRAKNNITNLGTITNFLDNKRIGLTLFTDKVYRKLARLHEVALLNQRTMLNTVNDIASQSGIENGWIGVEKLANQRFGFTKLGFIKTKTLNLIVTKTGRKYAADFNANQLLRIYALSKNSVQRNKLLEQGITDEVLADIKSDLGTELTTFADKMVGYLSTDYFNEVNAVYRQANDVNLGFVENYFPTKTITPKVDAKLLQEGNFNGIFSNDTAPAFKERTDMGSDINLKEGSFTNVLMNHMEVMERYKAYAIGVQELNAFMNIPAVNTLLEVSGLKSVTKLIVNAEINPQSAATVDGTQSTIVEYLQRKFTSFALAFKFMQILKQATSFVAPFEKYSYFKPDSKFPKRLQGPIDLAMFTVDAAGVLFEMAFDLVGKDGAIAKARRMSATFDKRVKEGLEGDVYGLETGSQTFKQAGKGSSLYAIGWNNFKRGAARPTIIGDIMGVMGYYINYKRNIANGMSEAQALEEFNEYNPTQQTRRNMDKIPLQLKGDAASKGFTMFGSTLFLQINKVMQSFTNISRAIAQNKNPRKQDIRAFYLNFAVANVFFVGMSNIFLLTKGDSEDRDIFMRRIKDAMMGLNLLYQIPYLGAAIEGGINHYRGDRKPVDDVVNPFSSIIGKGIREQRKDPDAWFKTYMKPILEFLLGAQADPFIGLHNAIKDGVFGDNTSSEEYYNNIYDFFGVTPSYRPGAYKRKSKGPDLEGIIPQGGINTKSDLKRYDPKLYEDVYGEIDAANKEQRELRKEILKEQGYVERNGKLYPID